MTYTNHLHSSSLFSVQTQHSNVIKKSPQNKVCCKKMISEKFRSSQRLFSYVVGFCWLLCTLKVTCWIHHDPMSGCQGTRAWTTYKNYVNMSISLQTKHSVLTNALHGRWNVCITVHMSSAIENVVQISSMRCCLRCNRTAILSVLLLVLFSTYVSFSSEWFFETICQW